MLVTELFVRDIPEIYRAFAQSIGEKHWAGCVTRCKQAIKGNPYLQEYLQSENDIAYQLSALNDLFSVPFSRVHDEDALIPLYPAASFAAQALSILRARTRAEADQFRRRIHGAFRNPADMRGLRLELSAATHFLRQGCRVSFPETTGVGRFDLLVERELSPPLEVECKSIGDDKGRKVHRLEMFEFAHLLRNDAWPYIKNLTDGLAVVLTVPGRLPTHYKDRKLLAKTITGAIIKSSSGALPDGSNLRIADFDAGALGAVSRHRDPDSIRRAAENATGTTNQHMAIIGMRSGGVLAFAVQSQGDDDLLTAVFDTLSQAASSQLTGTRAGLLWTGFDGVNSEQLLSVAQQDRDPRQPPTALRVAVSKFLSAANRDHVIGVGFGSRGALAPKAAGTLSLEGAAYYFPKRESAYWAASFDDLYHWA